MTVGVVAGTGPFDDEPDGDLGGWLVEHRAEMDRGEYGWLVNLARFDRDELWALDGQLTVVAWLCWRASLARQTAYDKVRVARALMQRDVLRAAFAEGRISYSAVRAISRLKEPGDDVDEALVRLAEVALVADVEVAVRTYQAYADQEMAPDERWSHRSFRVGTPVGGLSRLDGAVTETEGDEISVAVDAFREKLWREKANPSGEDDPGGTVVSDAVGEPAGEPAGESGLPSREESREAVRVSKADALMAMVRTAMAHLGDKTTISSEDAVMVHYVHHGTTGVVTRLDGSPVAPSLAGAVCCDSTRVEHLVGGQGEPLRLGRKTRQWSTAQRRAINLRDGGRCRFPGCDHTMTQIHHCRHWQDGGGTDVDNGALLCPRHHAMHHAGFVIEGIRTGRCGSPAPMGPPSA